MNLYSLWFAIPGAFLIVLFPVLPFLIFEIARKRRQKVQRAVAKREWEINYRERHIQQLERENEDFEGWLERLHAQVDSLQEMQEFWERLKISPLSANHILQQIWTAQDQARPQPPPYRPDRDLITYIEKGQKPPQQAKSPKRDYYVPDARDFTY